MKKRFLFHSDAMGDATVPKAAPLPRWSRRLPKWLPLFVAAVCCSGVLSPSFAVTANELPAPLLATAMGDPTALPQSPWREQRSLRERLPLLSRSLSVDSGEQNLIASLQAKRSALLTKSAPPAAEAKSGNVISSFGNALLGLLTPAETDDATKQSLDSTKENYKDTVKTAPIAAADPQQPGLFSRYTNAVQEVILKGLGLIGTAYRYGGNSVAEGLDCSGFVRLVFNSAVGLVLPRTASEMSGEGVAVQRDELRPGDLVFFNTMRRTFSHVGIYIGDNTFVHAPRTGARIRIEDMSNQYWMARYNGARRIIDIVKGRTPTPTSAGPDETAKN